MPLLDWDFSKAHYAEIRANKPYRVKKWTTLDWVDSEGKSQNSLNRKQRKLEGAKSVLRECSEEYRQCIAVLELHGCILQTVFSDNSYSYASSSVDGVWIGSSENDWNRYIESLLAKGEFKVKPITGEFIYAYLLQLPYSFQFADGIIRPRLGLPIFRDIKEDNEAIDRDRKNFEEIVCQADHMWRDYAKCSSLLPFGNASCLKDLEWAREYWPEKCLQNEREEFLQWLEDRADRRIAGNIEIEKLFPEEVQATEEKEDCFALWDKVFSKQ